MIHLHIYRNLFPLHLFLYHTLSISLFIYFFFPSHLPSCIFKNTLIGGSELLGAINNIHAIGNHTYSNPHLFYLF